MYLFCPMCGSQFGGLHPDMWTVGEIRKSGDYCKKPGNKPCAGILVARLIQPGPKPPRREAFEVGRKLEQFVASESCNDARDLGRFWDCDGLPTWVRVLRVD